MRTTSLTSFLVLALAAFGCTGELESPDGVVYAGSGCPVTICGGNSHEVARNGMHEASLLGELDDNKISLETNVSSAKDKPVRAQIWDHQGHPYDLHVEMGQLFGVDPSTGATLAGGGLIGATLHVLQGGSPLYHIRIDGVRTIPTPVGPPDPIEVYTMIWLPQNSSQQGDLCEQVFDDSKDKDELLGMRSNETLVFEGDRINARTKTMSQDQDWDPSWFNFGCAGRTLAKLRLLRKTQGNGTGGWASRQSALKMLAADYCGTGDAFTRTGTRIAWMDDEGLVEYVLPPTTIEARWNEHGATCVSSPRLESAVPYIWDYITDTCLPIPCYDTDVTTPDVYELAGAKIVSALYQ